MSLEALNTVGTLATVAIVAATAIAALVQLRHLRASNQINAMLSIGDRFDGSLYQDAMEIVRQRLAAGFADPAFRTYEATIARGETPAPVDPAFVELRRAAIRVGNAFEELGILTKNGIIDREMFLDRYCGVIILAWQRLAGYTAFGRETSGFPQSWENFEYVVVLAQDYVARHPSTYPSGVRRINPKNPYPIQPASAEA